MRFAEYLLLEMTIGKAFAFAAKKHKGQFRKGSGEPYITHPLGTYRILRAIGVKDKNILVGAALHDTREDTKTTYNELKTEFNVDVANMVRDVSSDKKIIFKVGKEKYLADKLLKIANPSLTLKLADRLHNLSDFHTVNKKFQKKMFLSTTYILGKLKAGRSLNGKQKKLVRKIEAILATYDQ
jgi:(p)ppGpp synthase/HD superfamily hydrolase